MNEVNQIPFDFDPRMGIVVAIMVGFLVFAVSLDLTWDKLFRVIKKPKAPGIGLVAQFAILPAVAFTSGLYLTDEPGVALGLLLVACCPGGALSNYLTGVAKGDVATSVSMTTVSTLFSIILTPVLFAFWASLNPSTFSVLENISVSLQQVIVSLLIMLFIPVTSGIIMRTKYPDTTSRIRKKIRVIAGIAFSVIVAMIIGSNFGSLAVLAQTALSPVILTFVVAVGLGWGLGALTRLRQAERRAIAIEVAFQNVALAIGLGVTFFPSFAGVAAVAILWGIVHLTFGTGLALVWSRA